MSDGPIRNLTILSPSMGQIVLQPEVNEPRDLERAQLVIYPHRILNTCFNVAIEWAVSTQTPIFCHSRDIPKFEKEGFGAYRFHKLEGYKEVDFHGGSVEFFPAHRSRQSGLRAYLTEASERLGLLGTPSYHVLIHPRGEASVLFLTTPQIDEPQWELLIRAKPAWIIGSEFVAKHEWLAFSTRVKRPILWAQEVAALKTASEDNFEKGSVSAEWAAKAGSF